MSNKELAIRIVRNFFNDSFCYPYSKTLSVLYKIDLSQAFAWDKTPEGFNFWHKVYWDTIPDENILNQFLHKNLPINDSNFIMLDLFV